ncbi:MAG TPA: multiheme c-type cytochrome [Pseudomonadota bacterium]|nr:multiheme c-type cytochrome [Pseudomonadota bacterium]HNN53500.1 multiheme c-type cytochrome [Pseudomonadota bacterium]
MKHTLAIRLGLFGALSLLIGGCHGGKTKAPPLPATAAAPTQSHAIELLVATRMWNTTEPCGCTSTPLGDVARVAGLLQAAPGRSLLLDAGGLRYEPKSLPATRLAQARLKADFIEQTWRDLSAVTMVQPEDLRGRDGVAELSQGQRLVANLSGLPDGTTTAQVVRTVLGQKLGIVGLADPDAPWPAGITVSNPAAALTQQLDSLGKEGVKAVVVLAGMPRDKVRRLARKFPSVKLWVAGADDNVPDGAELPEQLDGAILVAPGHKGERLYRILLHPTAQGTLMWRLQLTDKQRQRQQNILQQRIQHAETLLVELQKDAAADPSFVKTRQDELTSLRNEQAQLARPSDDKDGFVTAELLPIAKTLPRDPNVRKKLDELDQQIGQANLQALSGPPPEALPGSPRYVGNTACLGACHFHEAAHKLWQTTQHSRAYRTLVDVGKQRSYDCVNCHSTGFENPAGCNIMTLDKWQQANTPPVGVGPDLRHVGCEVCHGPGSLHIANPGKTKIPQPRPSASTCLDCHTPEHSDTFEWKAYARGILGEGHGAATRESLGPGPTGRELRQAARKQFESH